MCFSTEVFRNEIPFNVLHNEENIDITVERFISFIFVDVTNVAINCNFYIYHPYVGTVNAKLTTVSLVINLLHFQVFRSWDANPQFQKRALDSNPHPISVFRFAVFWTSDHPKRYSDNMVSKLSVSLICELSCGNVCRPLSITPRSSSSEDFQ